MKYIDNTFDILDKYADEHMDEILDTILRKEYLSKLTKVEDILVGKAVVRPLAYEYYEYYPTPISIDNNEHMWYNTFNKWNWTKFENGVIKIEDDERRV